jgi:hypothetical protein
MEALRFPAGKKIGHDASRLFAFRILNVARDPAEESVDQEAKDEKRDEVRKTGHMILVSSSRSGSSRSETGKARGSACRHR